MKFLWVIMCLLLQPMAMAEQIVRYNVSKSFPDPKQNYYISLLKLALEETKASHGDYQLQAIPLDTSQSRSSMRLELGFDVDVNWRMTTADLEQRLSAVYIPLLKGLMGYRIFLIRAGEQSRFNQNISFSTLKNLVAGQGYDWPDTKILRHNKLKVITGNEHTLLDMLSKGRFDYFPRAINEPWLESKQKTGLQVEKNILLQYPAPIYFFVNANNKRLHERIKLGLSKAIDNGNFDKVFYQHSVTGNFVELAKLDQRKVFHLTNPLLSEKSKALINNPKLWLATEAKK